MDKPPLPGWNSTREKPIPWHGANFVVVNNATSRKYFFIDYLHVENNKTMLPVKNISLLILSSHQLSKKKKKKQEKKLSPSRFPLPPFPKKKKKKKNGETRPR